MLVTDEEGSNALFFTYFFEYGVECSAECNADTSGGCFCTFCNFFTLHVYSRNYVTQNILTGLTG